MKFMISWGKCFWKDEEGLETLELMLIIAVVVFIALMFKDRIIKWITGLLNYGDSKVSQFEN